MGKIYLNHNFASARLGDLNGQERVPGFNRNEALFSGIGKYVKIGGCKIYSLAFRRWVIIGKTVMNGFFFFSITILVLTPFVTSCSSIRNETAHNIIIMIPDGMGIANVTAARIYKNGLTGDPLHLETLQIIGHQKTFSKNSTITDSAAAASAWACGEKFNNSEICKHSEDGVHPSSILELAKSQGKATGLVATSTVTHATPAAFGAHVTDRSCENEIARQYIKITKPDVILGGGREKFNSILPDNCGTSGDFLSDAIRMGYTFAHTKKEMDAGVATLPSRLIGLFNDKELTSEYKRGIDISEPRLPEMVISALRILEKNPNGFFLLIEGSQIDGANHSHHDEYLMKEILAFDDAVKIVLDWMAEDPKRKRNTLLIIVPDHETGGFSITGPQNGLSTKGDLNSIKVRWETRHHTGTDTPIWSQGPGSKNLGRLIDNTELYRVMRDALIGK